MTKDGLDNYLFIHSFIHLLISLFRECLQMTPTIFSEFNI